MAYTFSNDKQVKEKQVNCRMGTDLHKILEVVADIEHSTVSAVVRQAVIDLIENNYRYLLAACSNEKKE